MGTRVNAASTLERAVLDTSILIAEDVEPVPGVLAVSAASFAELHYGVLVARTVEERARRLRRITLLARRFDPLPVDEAVAASYGQLAAAVVAAGRQPRRRVMDLLIAATAHAHGAALYTRNPGDFVGLESFIDLRTA